ncbi:MAG TPA: permease [Alphaproteobacteria bacterium]|jgi:uncharacterized membrane protein YfcA|nr:permease [Alphaproteobacteria bacterium]HBA42744.1 permease [Alphaproteobacteria bacterium]HBF98557.1 permease [Alphaproteobacteria bacterium]HCO90726.1 permease [Alphaproteobacteria bacterium]
MQIYLPVAELSVNIFLLLGMGAAVGFLSGMFGVGGGFLMTPLLIFAGVPPAVAVGTEANQIVAASFSGVLAHWKRAVDFKMGLVLLAGGAMGSTIGVTVFSFLRGLGQIDLAISLAYVLFLGTVGALMLVESVNAMRQSAQADVGRRKLHRHLWMHGLPFKMRFRRSRLYISAIPVLAIGMVVGFLAAIMGVGGGFIMVPAMIYLLGMPTNVVIGTSLFQITFVTALTTVLHSVTNQTVDVVLALILLASAVIGAQFGARMSGRLRGEQLRGLLALLVLLVCTRLAYGLVVTPDDLFVIGGAGG